MTNKLVPAFPLPYEYACSACAAHVPCHACEALYKRALASAWEARARLAVEALLVADDALMNHQVDAWQSVTVALGVTGNALAAIGPLPPPGAGG